MSCLQFATGLVSPKSDAAYVMYVYSITLCLSVIYHVTHFKRSALFSPGNSYLV